MMGKAEIMQVLKIELLADCTWSLCSILPLTGTPSHCI